MSLFEQIYCFYHDTKENGKNTSIEEIVTNKRSLNDIIASIKELKIPYNNKIECNQISLIEMKRHLLTFFKYLLDDKHIDDIQKYNGRIVLDDLGNKFESTLEYMLHPNNRIDITGFHIDKNLYDIETVFLAHEYMHALLLKHANNYNQVFSNIHYHELPSILTEYIACGFLKDEFNRYLLLEQIFLLRLNNQKKLINELEALEILAKNSNDESMKKIIEYQRHQQLTYLISDIYAARLFELYLRKYDILGSLNNIVDGTSSIDDMLKKYDVFLDSEETINTYKLRIYYFKDYLGY